MRQLLVDTTPLKVPEFRRLWQANIVTVIGAQLNIIAVPAHIYALTGNSAYVGLASLCGFVPLVVFGLYGGSLADSMDRRTLLHITTTGMILSAAGFWAFAATGGTSVWPLLALFAVQQGFFAVNQPTRVAIIATLVGRQQIAAATSLNMTVQQAGAIIGPVLGGMLIPILGFSWLYFLDFLALFATLYAVHRLPALPPRTTGDGQPAKAGIASVIDGFRFLLTQPIILMTFAIDLIAMVFGSPRALIPQMSAEDFGEQASGGIMYALLFAALPVGAVLGGLFSGVVTKIERRGLGVSCFVALWGVAILVMGLAVSAANGTVGLWAAVTLLAFAAGGAADMFSAVLRSTMLQEAATDEVRGRVQSVFFVVVAGGPRIADGLHGWAGSHYPAATVTTAGGGLVIIGTIVMLLVVPRFLTWTPAAALENIEAEHHGDADQGIQKEGS